MKAGKFAKALVRGVAKTAREMHDEKKDGPKAGVEYAFTPDRKWEEEMRERQRKADEGNRIKRDILSHLGVDVDLFTSGLVAHDVTRIVREFVPRSQELGIYDPAGHATVSFSNLTKAQRLPKCVATGSFACPGGDGVVATVRYLRNATPYSVDLNIWHGRLGLRVELREASSVLTIANVMSIDIDRDLRLPIYVRDSGGSAADAMELGVRYLLGGA